MHFFFNLKIRLTNEVRFSIIYTIFIDNKLLLAEIIIIIMKRAVILFLVIGFTSLLSCSKGENHVGNSTKVDVGIYKPLEYTEYRYALDNNNELTAIPNNRSNISGSMLIESDYGFVLKYRINESQPVDVLGKIDINSNSIIDSKGQIHKYSTKQGILVIDFYAKGPLFGDRDEITQGKELLVLQLHFNKV